MTISTDTCIAAQQGDVDLDETGLEMFLTFLTAHEAGLGGE